MQVAILLVYLFYGSDSWAVSDYQVGKLSYVSKMEEGKAEIFSLSVFYI